MLLVALEFGRYTPSPESGPASVLASRENGPQIAKAAIRRAAIPTISREFRFIFIGKSGEIANTMGLSEGA